MSFLLEITRSVFREVIDSSWAERRANARFLLVELWFISIPAGLVLGCLFGAIFTNGPATWILLGIPLLIALVLIVIALPREMPRPIGGLDEVREEISSDPGVQPETTRPPLLPVLRESVSVRNYRRDTRRISPSVRYRVLKRDGFKCRACGRSPALGPYEDGTPVELVADHVIAWAKGGSSDESNLQTLCFRCNAGKSDKN